MVEAISGLRSSLKLVGGGVVFFMCTNTELMEAKEYCYSITHSAMFCALSEIKKLFQIALSH